MIKYATQIGPFRNFQKSNELKIWLLEIAHVVHGQDYLGKFLKISENWVEFHKIKQNLPQLNKEKQSLPKK